MTIALIRTVILYLLIIFGIKIMGKRQISDLQTSELVITILISNIAAVPMQDSAQPLLSSVIPIISLICYEILVSFFMLKNAKIRELICGKPIILIKEGKVQQTALKNLRISCEDLFEQLRQADVFSLDDVWFAIMETNGQLSVLKKPERQPPDATMLKIETNPATIDTIVVSDGIISEHSLKVCNLDQTWLNNIIKKENIKLENIFIMTANKNKKFRIIRKEKNQ